MLPVGNMDTWGGICYNFFCKKSNRHGSIPRHHSGMVFDAQGELPRASQCWGGTEAK